MIHWGALSLYWVWTVAGGLDFLCHRRTHLPTTSGTAESRMHLVQMALCGGATLLWLILEPTAGFALMLLVLVIAHAWAGYLDTRAAFRSVRIVLPVEQHLHSILDVAPWLAWAAIAWLAASDADLDWALGVRQSPLPLTVWALVLMPALALCVPPALLEYRDALRASGSRRA